MQTLRQTYTIVKVGHIGNVGAHWGIYTLIKVGLMRDIEEAFFEIFLTLAGFLLHEIQMRMDTLECICKGANRSNWALGVD